MLKTTIYSFLICCLAILSACSSSNELPRELTPVLLGEQGANNNSENGPDEPVQDGQDQGENNADSSQNWTQLYTGILDWDLSEFEVESTNVDREVYTEQRFVLAKSDDMNCVARIQHFKDDIGLELAFTQDSVSADGQFIRIDEFEAQNGPAKRYLRLHTQSNDLQVNTIGHYYYFPAEQTTFNRHAVFNLYCITDATEYAANDTRMQWLMNNISFRVAQQLDNLVAENWTNLESEDTGDTSRIVFRNETNDRLEIFWITYEGDLRSIDTVEPDAQQRINTGFGHLFIVKDSSGNTRGQFRADKQDTIAVIR